ncbi:MAG: hypothetical protein HYZ14_10975 [Bacteroidetes bacterium]|nr:hypothetical protein [Bacteroidota bacterium]
MTQKTQNYKNHRRILPAYHYLTYGLIALILVAGSLIAFKGERYFMGAVVTLIGLTIALIGFFARAFALKAQDRAIRAEENFRYYVLTGKRLSSNLRLGQIIALRFASDDELAALAERAEKENLSSREIKMAIQNWRGDFHRV